MFLHKCSRKLHTSQKGFTLIELIVVMTVMAIVISLTAMGILSWMDWSAFQKENEYAQTLFIAAQNQLSEYAANGRLTELMDSLADGSYEDAVLDDSRAEIFCPQTRYGMNLTNRMDKLTDSQGNAYDLKTIFPESAGKAGDKVKLYQEEIVSLRAEAGDYEKYLADPMAFKNSDPEAFWVFELLGAYVYDTTILNGSKSGGSASGASICVELTPHGGQVFSVLYTDKANQFIYLGLPDSKGSEESAGVLNISDRRETYRRERKIGYYGVDTLYASTENKMVRPGISYVKLYNKETFYLIAKLAEKSKPLIGKMSYEIDLDASKDANDKKLTILLDGTKLKNAESTTEPIECPVYRYEYKDDGTGKHVLTKTELGSFPFLAWMESGAIIHVVYDAADIQATTFRYESELDTLRLPDANAAAAASFSDTYSFFRFGLDADDVYATIKGSAEGYADTKSTSNFGNINPTKNQTGKNPCFASFYSKTTGDETDFKYTLLNERHFYNIRYIEDISYEKEAGGYQNTSKIAGVQFVLKSDLDFAKFQAEGNLYNSNVTESRVDLTQLNQKLYTLKDKEIEAVTRYNCEFPTFKQLRVRDSFDGGNKKVKGILSSELSNVLYMLYLDPNSVTAPMKGRKPIGLFNVNYGLIENLYLDDFSVKGSDMVGSFCGINAGSIDNVTTLNTNHVSCVSGVKNVGGIMGFQIVAGTSAEIKGLTNRADVYGTEAVGGIVGMARNSFKDFDFTDLALTVDQLNGLKSDTPKNIKIEKCSNYGPVFGFGKGDLKGVYVQSAGGKKAKAAGMPDDDPEKIRYIGGIVGYCYNADEKDMNRILISDCISSPQYAEEDLNTILSDKKKLSEKLKGDYVGGIAGYNYYGTVQNCSTKAEKGTTGCIFGYRYVGGIVGLNIGPSSGIIGGDTLNKGINENHVVGCYYVGGITGANANVKDEAKAYDKSTTIKSKDPEILSKSDAILEPASDRSLEVKIENWTNRGVVIATKEYAGGITGFNAGWIYKCFSEVSASSVDTYFKTMLNTYDLGDYCGGIAGYNNGIIGNTERVVSADKKSSKTKGAPGSLILAEVYVNGHNYVGGIVGYNDVDSIVEDYQVTSGYVRGYAHRFEDNARSCFVGGYAGLNSSVDLLMNLESTEKEARFIHSNPNQVKGDYFVGGTIGGNIINTKNFNDGTTIPDGNSGTGTPASGAEGKDILAQYLTDNFLGILDGREFVGGYIGYNLLLENDDKDAWIVKDADGDRGAVYVLQKLILDAFAESDIRNAELSDSLASKKSILDDLDTALSDAGSKVSVKKSPSKILISGKGTEATKTEFGSIYGEIYVGGVLGYNDNETLLTVKNVENATPIFARSAIVYKSEQMVDGQIRTTNYIGEDWTYTYSYAGGIIGKVSKNTVIDHCWNSFSGSVSTKGTYTGGLCEINEGIVKNCDVSNFGSGVDDYLGGICGLNKETGIIQECNFENKTVSGRNVVGGIAAENFGKIKQIKLKTPRIRASALTTGSKDGVVGLFTGYNGLSGDIELSEDLQAVSVKSDGCYAGAVAGVNEGSVSNLKTNSSDITGNLAISGNIEGYYDVGALVGLNKDPDKTHTVSNYTNKATIIALNGNAGGIVGENASANSIRYCVNDAVVSATVGNAGGIVSVNTGEISHCFGYKTVSAPKGMSGGITAINGDKAHKDAVISQCYVGPDKSGSVLGSVTKVTFVSTQSVGGVAAVNYGVIEENILENVIVTNIGTIMHTSIGVVVGDNAAGGRVYLKGNTENIKNCQAVAKTNNCNIGGVAGTNDGLIANKESYEAKSADVYGYALIGAEAKLDGASYSSLGGVAGLNTGIIAYCQVDTKIEGLLGTEKTGYGGIAGYSGYSTQAEYAAAKQTNHADETDKNGTNIYKAKIIGCTFDGSVSAPGSAGNPANIGGITGVNGYGGYIEDCALGVRDKNLNGTEDKITSITSGDLSKPVLTANNSKTDTKAYAYIGGVAGRNYAEIRNVDMKPVSTDEEINVIAFAGAIGGMVGFEYPGASVSGEKDKATGIVKWTSTPATMKVEMRSGENDYGVGGIIGYCKSGMPVSYIRNFAHVENYVNLNVKTGGVIGTLEQQKVICVDISNCENYGKIEGRKQIGGLIGRTKFCAVRMTDCDNYGEVYALDGNAGGLIACIYDIQKAECYFTGCDNHGYVHNGTNNNSNYAGGLVSAINGTCVLTTYVYDCDNTGIVERNGVTTPSQNCGSFVGSGTGSTWYFEQCQNYGVSKCTNGFIGNGDGACIMRFKDCLDNSNSKTKLAGFSPFLGSNINGNAYSNDTKSTSKSTFRNVYYLDQNSAASEERFTKAAGAYFTINRVTNFTDFYYQGRQYQNLKNPALYLTAPSEHTYMRIKNNSSLELHVAYDKTKCAGIRDFNIYFWNGKVATQTTGENITRTVKAVFTDIEGKTETVTEQISRVEGENWLNDKLTLTVPAGLKPEIRDIRLTFSGGECCLHGFTYTPAGASKEAACTYIGEKNDTTFSLVSIKNNGTAKAVNPNGIVTHSISSFDDLLGLEFYKTDAGGEEYFRYDRTGNGGVLDIDFDVQNGPNASGMDSFVFILGTGDDKDGTKVRQYCADYKVTFTDINNKTATVIGSRADGTGAIGYHSTHAKSMDGTVVKVPDELDKRITHVRVSITDLVRWWTEPGTDADMTTAPTLNQSYVFLRGFRWIPVDSTEAEYMGVGLRPAKGMEEYTTPACITKLYCDYSGNAASPYVFTENDYELGFRMSNNDPIHAIYYADRDSYSVSKEKADGSDSRINVYHDLHPKFIQMIQEIYAVLRKLETPAPTVEEKNGRFVVSWKEISGAYSYEVKYELKDETGKTVSEFEIFSQGAGSQSFTIPINEDWKGHRIVFSVRAVNAYRYTGNDPSYDSDWGTVETAVKDALQQPVVHAELTAGNKMVMILDNRDDYKIAEGVYKDCNIEIDYGKNPAYKFNISVADGFVSDTAEYINGWKIGDDYALNAVAKPTAATSDIYSESIAYYVAGHMVDNLMLLTLDQYVETRFRGFYGNQADQMTYDVYYTAPSGRDCYLKSDIVAYDKTIGEEVSYSNMMTHVASFGGGYTYFTASLSDLPMEWFSEDFETPITVREYLSHSQYDIVRYGHIAATDVVLDGATPEENQNILAAIRDPYYLSADDSHVFVENAAICENGVLKPGYVLQLKRDEYGNKLYDIYYNASIELAVRAAETQNVGRSAKYAYYKHCVDYKQYTADKLSAVLANSGSTNLSTEKTYAGINRDDYQETYLVRNYKDGTQLAEAFPASNNNNSLKIQELQPAPVIDEAFQSDPVDGHRSFTFTFDEYYKDVFCMTLNNTQNKNTWYTSTDTKYLTQAGDDVATTWAAFAAKAGYNTETNAAVKRRIMNAYYYSYLNASYRVDLIGTTISGEEAVITTTTVTTPTRLADKTKTYDINGTSYTATYECYNYQVTFTDTDDIWNNYSDFTVRVMRIGEPKWITSGINVPDISNKVKNEDVNNSTLRLPRYSDYKIHVKMKLNTINNPTAELHKDNSAYVMDNLTYDVAFGAITNTDQIKDLGGYLITVEKILDPAVGGDKNTHYYYVKDYDNTIENNDIGINIDALMQNGVVNEIDTEKEYVKNGNSRTVFIDLSDFETKDQVQINIKAIASTKAENYTDSDEGTGTIVEIFERLKTPIMSYLTVSHPTETPAEVGMNDASVAGAAQSVEMGKYEEGMYLAYGEDVNYSSILDARMNMSVAVYDNCTAADKADVSKKKAGDEGDGAWNDKALVTLSTKKNPLDMGMISTHTPTKIDLVENEKYPGQFAGKWIKIALKASINSKIDSQWTDQDNSDKNTINYKWVQIPKLKLSDVALSDDVTVRYDYKSGGLETLYDKEEDVPKNVYGSVTTRLSAQTLAVAEDKCVDAYDFTIIQKEAETMVKKVSASGNEEFVSALKIPKYRILLERHLENINGVDIFDGTWDVSLMDLSLISTDDGSTWEAANAGAVPVSIGKIGSTLEEVGSNPAQRDIQILPITDITSVLGVNGTEFVYASHAELRYEPGEKSGTFKLVLPDINAIEETDCSGTAEYLTTQDVLVRTYIQDEADSNYIRGKAASWSRTNVKMTDDEGQVVKDGNNHEKYKNSIASLNDSDLPAWYTKNGMKDPYDVSGSNIMEPESFSPLNEGTNPTETRQVSGNGM